LQFNRGRPSNSCKHRHLDHISLQGNIILINIDIVHPQALDVTHEVHVYHIYAKSILSKVGYPGYA